MKTTCLKALIVLLMTIVVGGPPAWAKQKGYCYVVSYSLRQKVVFLTPVFTADVSGAVYSDEEFVADVELIRKIENQFQQHLTNVGLNRSDYITEARVGFRTQAIAAQRLAKEKSGFESRGYRIKKTGSFAYKD
jgi:hypothetical protein